MLPIENILCNFVDSKKNINVRIEPSENNFVLKFYWGKIMLNGLDKFQSIGLNFVLTPPLNLPDGPNPMIFSVPKT